MLKKKLGGLVNNYRFESLDQAKSRLSFAHTSFSSYVYFIETLQRKAPQELCFLPISLFVAQKPCPTWKTRWLELACFPLSPLPSQTGSVLPYRKDLFQGQQLFTFCKISVTFKAGNNDLKLAPGLHFENSKMY